jgi:antitoxin component of MazEF toxin-antitoxin module
MRRKVFRSGNSLVIALPPEARQLGTVAGSEVEVVVEANRVVIESWDATIKQVLRWTDEFVNRHRDLLQRLA